VDRSELDRRHLEAAAGRHDLGDRPATAVNLDAGAGELHARDLDQLERERQRVLDREVSLDELVGRRLGLAEGSDPHGALGMLRPRLGGAAPTTPPNSRRTAAPAVNVFGSLVRLALWMRHCREVALGF
jgi:hypothetical protein